MCVDRGPLGARKNLEKPNVRPLMALEFEIRNAAVDIRELPMMTRSQLALYNGVDRPALYVAINGYIYDVSANDKNYGVGKLYHALVGKDVSRLLALNRLSLKEGDAPTTTWYTRDLDERQRAVVDKWVVYFKKRYDIVGVVVHHEADHAEQMARE